MAPVKGLIKTIFKDIYDVRKMPKNVHSGWKHGADIAKKQKQSIFTGVKTRAKEASKRVIVPNLPAVTALFTCWIPLPGMTSSGYALGTWLRKIISKKLGLPL